MDNVIKVGMADLQCSRHPGVLTTLGLGSCVGIALFDPVKKIIGLAHIMLPSSIQVNNNANIAKFADTATVRMLDDMLKLGASRTNIIAKLAGGAQMFAFSSASEIMRIGFRNVASAKEKLAELSIPVVAEDTGGSYGRTIELYSENGELVIKTIGHGVRKI
jgi:chemotaxis protein CheD